MRISRDFCTVWPGVSLEDVARGNHLPQGTWRLRIGPDGRAIEVTGWFLASDARKKEDQMRRSTEDSWTIS